MANLFTVDNIIIGGLVAGTAAYLADFNGFKGTVNGWIDDLKNTMTFTGYDPIVPDEAAAVEGGNEGGVLQEPVVVQEPKPEPSPIAGEDTSGAWAADNFMWGGYEFPSEDAFNQNDYYPIEGSEGGIAPELKEYTMLIPKWNILPDVRGHTRRQADNIEYQMG